MRRENKKPPCLAGQRDHEGSTKVHRWGGGGSVDLGDFRYTIIEIVVKRLYTISDRDLITRSMMPNSRAFSALMKLSRSIAFSMVSID